MNKKLDAAEQKKLAAEYAVDTLFSEGKIFSGIKIGLGTGSTAIHAVRKIAALVEAGTLKDIFAVPTSYQTSVECEKLGLPIYSLNSRLIEGGLDLTIDGADEADEHKNLIKGGGAALLKEKITAYNSAQFVIVADERKKVKTLGTGFALPVEIAPDAMTSIIKQLEKDGAAAVLREGVRKMGPVITDNGNVIIDVRWPRPLQSPEKTEDSLNRITGVIENGLFTKIKPRIFIAHADGSVEDL